LKTTFDDFLNEKNEIQHFGFLDTDLLTTCVINDTNGTLYLFNWGNYGKTRNFLLSISMCDEDKSEIEDWLCDRLRDENMDDINPNITSIEIIDKNNITDTDFLSKYPENEIGNEVVKIDFLF